MRPCYPPTCESREDFLGPSSSTSPPPFSDPGAKVKDHLVGEWLGWEGFSAGTPNCVGKGQGLTWGSGLRTFPTHTHTPKEISVGQWHLFGMSPEQVQWAMEAGVLRACSPAHPACSGMEGGLCSLPPPQFSSCTLKSERLEAGEEVQPGALW